MSTDIFLNQILLELIDYLLLAYSKIDDDSKGFKTWKSESKIIKLLPMKKTFMIK